MKQLILFFLLFAFKVHSADEYIVEEGSCKDHVITAQYMGNSIEQHLKEGGMDTDVWNFSFETSSWYHNILGKTDFLVSFFITPPRSYNADTFFNSIVCQVKLSNPMNIEPYLVFRCANDVVNGEMQVPAMSLPLQC